MAAHTRGPRNDCCGGLQAVCVRIIGRLRRNSLSCLTVNPADCRGRLDTAGVAGCGQVRRQCYQWPVVGSRYAASLAKTVESIESNWLAAGERLSKSGPDEPPPIGRLVTQLFQKCGAFAVASDDELAAIAGDRGDLLRPMLANVQHECRLGSQSQMDAVIVINPRRMMRLSRHVGVGEFRPESGVLNQLGGGDMVRMRIDPVRCQQPGGTHLAAARMPTDVALPTWLADCDWVIPSYRANRVAVSSWLLRSLARALRDCRAASARHWSSPARRHGDLRLSIGGSGPLRLVPRRRDAGQSQDNRAWVPPWRECGRSVIRRRPARSGSPNPRRATDRVRSSYWPDCLERWPVDPVG